MTESASLSAVSALVFISLAALIAVLSYARPWCAAAALAASAPFAWYHQLGPTELTLSKAVTAGAAAGLLTLFARDPSRRATAQLRLRHDAALWFLVAFALLSLVSAAWAESKADALRDALKWLWYVAVFAMSGIAAASRPDRLKIATALFITAAIVAVYGLTQIGAAPHAFIASNGAIIGRISSTLEGPNQFGGYLEIVIPMLLAVLLFARLRVAPFVAGSLLLGALVAALLLTYSRGALWSCGIAVGFVVVSAVVRRTALQHARVITPARIAALIVLTLAVAAPIAGSSITSLGWQREFSPSDASGSVLNREALWTCAGRLFSRHPIAGVGAGNFADAKGGCGVATIADHSNANEWYFETAADLGTVGLGVLLAFLAAVAARVRGPALWADPVGIGAFAAFIALALHGFVDDLMPYPKAALPFFTVLGLIPLVVPQGRALWSGRSTAPCVSPSSAPTDKLEATPSAPRDSAGLTS